MRTVGVILARSDSSRLPGKVFMDLGGGHTLLGLVMARAARSRRLDGLVLATTDRPCDDALAEWAAGELKVSVFRGETEQVALRLLRAAEGRRAEAFVRLNGDSPFLDGALLDEGIALARASGADLVTNLRPRSYPYGIAVEVFRAASFRRVVEKFDAFEQEHVSQYFYRRPGEFEIVSLPPCPGDSLAEVRLTIDDEADRAKMRALVERLGAEVVSAGYARVAQLAMGLDGRYPDGATPKAPRRES